MVSIIDRVRGRNLPSIPEPEPEDIFVEMTLQEHLEELRTRVMYSALSIAIGFVVGLILSRPLLEQMAAWSGLQELQVISPTEGFVTYMKVALYIGIAIAMPVLVYQIVAFLGPGLTRQERSYLRTALPFVSAMFIAGVLFAFFVVIPRALGFLAGFGDEVFDAQFRASEVVQFYMTLMLWLGVVFEMPIVIFLLAKLRVVSAQRLASIRKFMLVGIMIAAAIITPTPDPFNMMMVATPMYVLYEFGILLARIAVRESPEPEPESSE
jgi:sec-independent protein translocase protein TatC